VLFPAPLLTIPLKEKAYMFINLRKVEKIGLFLLFSATALAQNSGSAFVSFGYRLPPAEIAAAPGQILMISVSGSRMQLSGPVRATVDSAGNYPTELAGFTVSLLQADDPKQVQAQIIGIKQAGCTDPSCAMITSITLQIPSELKVPSTASLLVNDAAGLLINIPVHAVSDSVHVLNSCDQTSVFQSQFDGQSFPGCVPAVISNNQLSGPANPVRPGDTVAVFLYGVGISGVPGVTFAHDFRENAGGRSSNFAGGDVPAFIGPISKWGLYQANFIIPQIPPGLTVFVCDGQRIQSNLTVTVSGATSADEIRLCIQP
jgi:uncharacterized protein (TIGR03437 family)